MKDRLLSATVIVVLFLLFAAFSEYVIVLKILIVLLSAASLTEIFVISKWVKQKYLRVVPYITSLIIPLLPNMNCDWIYSLVFIVVMVSFVIVVAGYRNVGIEHIFAVFFISLIVPLFYTAIVYLRSVSSGICWFYAVFMCAWGSDAGGYVFGHMFGKHKLAPHISPNKTIEGLVGGFVTSAAGMAVIGFFAELFGNYKVNYISLTVCAVIGSAAGVIGDLAASATKRRFGVKDFGKIIPGHGGIMDRFDSVLFAAPALLLVFNVTSLVFTELGIDWTVFKI